MRDDVRAADIVRFWRAIEMFSPQTVPPLERGERSGNSSVFELRPDHLAPWQPRHPLKTRELPANTTRLYTVYGGLYDISQIRQRLERAFGADEEAADIRRVGTTAMFAFTVDVEGRVLENSATLSACAWALYRLSVAGPKDPRWLDGFSSDERSFVAAFDTLSPPKLVPAEGDTPSFGAKVGDAVAGRLKSAGRDAWESGAKATGSAVKAAVVGAGSALAGPVVGGIAAEVAGTFVEKLLSLGQADPENPATDPGETVAAPRFDLTARALHDFVGDLAKALGIADLGVAGVRVACTIVPTRIAEKPDQQVFLNSFIADDLSRIEKDVRDGRVGGALGNYLVRGDDIAVTNRIDVRSRRHRDRLVDGVAPHHIPGGRWPAGTNRSLVMSQQFAVNRILDELGNQAGIFSVNGPPGTGKTTMLRDVLAGLVVERARRLAGLGNPHDAFADVQGEVQLSQHYRARVRGLRPQLTGFEVVLATATNDAATNVTAEIPGVKAVNGAVDDALAAGYFPELATRVLDDEAWGLIAAVLGNMKNRNDFANRFWWNDGMKAVLKQVRDDQIEVDDWNAATARFREAERKVRELTLDRQQIADAIREIRSREAEIPGLERALAAARTDCARHEATSAHLNRDFQHAGAVHAGWDREYQNHLRHKPGFWVSLSTGFKAGRLWARQHLQLADERAQTRRELDRLHAEAGRAHAELHVAQQERHRLDQELARVRASAADARRRVDDARARWPGKVPTDDLADEPFQLCSPWADEALCTARTNLFLEALRLHKAFVLGSGARVRDNLAVITEVIKRNVEVGSEALHAAWQTLFLVVPMISTTFASLPRLLDGLGQEALGWLFIDEAGQATPQQAAGGLWRCRRAVIVGDPQQLEPIVTLPRSAQRALRRFHGVDQEWLPDGTSVQRVADRPARYGTYLTAPDGDDRVWVGAPLRVHRRCDRPIFDVSNRIAYGGDLMIYGTAQRAVHPGANAWIDVRSAQSDDKWVPEEGRALETLLSELSAAGVSEGNIRVISPFRRVVSGSKASARAVFGRDFARENVGTVHTVQGKEADVVVLVLGTGPENVRARGWAAQKPNLLNVAVSRAKRRLYVIGNRASWRSLPYFHVLADALPVRSHSA